MSEESTVKDFLIVIQSIVVGALLLMTTLVGSISICTQLIMTLYEIAHHEHHLKGLFCGQTYRLSMVQTSAIHHVSHQVY